MEFMITCYHCLLQNQIGCKPSEMLDRISSLEIQAKTSKIQFHVVIFNYFKISPTKENMSEYILAHFLDMQNMSLLCKHSLLALVLTGITYTRAVLISIIYNHLLNIAAITEVSSEFCRVPRQGRNLGTLVQENRG